MHEQDSILSCPEVADAFAVVRPEWIDWRKAEQAARTACPDAAQATLRQGVEDVRGIYEGALFNRRAHWAHVQAGRRRKDTPQALALKQAYEHWRRWNAGMLPGLKSKEALAKVCVKRWPESGCVEVLVRRFGQWKRELNDRNPTE